MSFLEHDRVPGPRPIAAKEVPLVNRTEEMNVLKEAVDRALHGEGARARAHTQMFCCQVDIVSTAKAN